MNKIYSIYLFTFPNNKKYCGYTSQAVERRWNNGNGYDKCPLVHKAIIKYGWENIKKEVIFTTSNQQAAYDKEKEIIAKLQLQNPEYGYNLDEGGRPRSPDTYLSPEGRKRKSEEMKAHWADPAYRAKMAIAMKNNTFSEEARLKGVQISADKRRGKIANNAQPVIQIDKDTDKIIKEFPSATAAAVELMGNVTGCSNILNVCKGKRKTAYGYKWRYKE